MTMVTPTTLADARTIVEPALRGAVGRLSPSVRRVAEYHLGYVDVDGRPSAANAGKALRPTLALLAAQWAGGEAEIGVPGAVAVELAHNFSLLHDDVMDHDVLRRHRPAAWAVFGVGPAILAGDAMLALAAQVVLDSSGAASRAAAALVMEATIALIDGQGLDLDFETRDSVSFEDWLAMCAGKTAALLACSAAVGAVLADAPGEVVAGMHGFGHHLGLAFQAVDDLLGIWGAPDVTGKVAYSDLRQRKKTLPVVAALQSGVPEAGELAELLVHPELDDDVVQRMATLVDACGGRAFAGEEAERRLKTALDHIDGLGLEPWVHAALNELAAFVTCRNH